MAVFRNQSKKAQAQHTTHLQPEGDHKVHTDNIHDPILTAVNEAQPFEEANQHINRRPLYLSQESGELKDIFGNRIRQQDMLNPTRLRNERPLDTIRAFEYAITGDMVYRDQLELNRLGWGFHEDFPHYSYGGEEERAPQDAAYSRPVASFGEQAVYKAGNYSASSLNPEVKQKKKRGLFGKKK